MGFAVWESIQTTSPLSQPPCLQEQVDFPLLSLAVKVDVMRLLRAVFTLPAGHARQPAWEIQGMGNTVLGRNLPPYLASSFSLGCFP